MDEDRPEMSDAEAAATLSGLFPGARWLEDVEAELRADGWIKPRGDLPLAHEVGLGVWDVFSNNHDVTAADGRIVHLGSFRGSGGTIADFLNERIDGARYDYMDFYMGSFVEKGDASVAAVHRLIFRRLRERGFDWKYAFPRIFAVRFARPEPTDDPSHPDWKPYSPEAAFLREEKERKRAAEDAEFDELLERGYREDLDRAKREAPPPIVLAYRAVYGRDPRGWPPWEE